MDKGTIESLKFELADAIERNDRIRIEEISKKLNIPYEQSKFFEQGLTGYPSMDKVWLKNYSEGAEEKALSNISFKISSPPKNAAKPHIYLHFTFVRFYDIIYKK